MTRFRHGLLSIKGNFRSNNEDAAHVDPAGRVFLVCDGMGGQAAGEKASGLAVELIPAALADAIDWNGSTPEQVSAALDRAVVHANDEIMAAGALDPDQHQMGTTVVFAVHVRGTLLVGGVGDSRVYRLRRGELEQLTVDHSLVQALVEAGTIKPEDAGSHRYRNVLYRYLGSKEGGQGAGAKPVVPKAGDRYVLCSDGVTDGLPDARIKEVLAAEPDPQAAAEAIVAAAERGGSRDNITCLTLYAD